MSTSFPKLPLEQAIALPEALQRNGGNGMTVIDLATALDISPGSSVIRTLSAASSAYGLTGGGLKSVTTMKPLGAAITSPTKEGEREQSLVEAFLQVPLFQQIYDYYKGKKSPERQFLVNTVVREFGVPAGSAESVADIFVANLTFVGLVRETKGGAWITTEASVPVAGGLSSLADAVDDGSEYDRGLTGDEDVLEPDASPPPPPPAGNEQRQKRPNKLFVGHGRNKKPLEQLTKVLRDLGIPHLVAEDEPNAGRPISAKVRETMEQCGAAILIFSADVEYFDKDGEPVWRPSENVSHELGAAAVMYEDRIILFKEESVSLASNFSGIGYIPFEKDKLDAETNALLRELVGLKILRLSVGGDD